MRQVAVALTEAGAAMVVVADSVVVRAVLAAAEAVWEARAAREGTVAREVAAD